MITLGELKTNIMKILCEYSKNGRILTEDVSSVADRKLHIDFAVDVALRKVMTICGLEKDEITVEAAKNENVFLSIPQDFAAVELLISPSGATYKNCVDIIGSSLCFRPKEAGKYSIIYRHFPHSIAGKDDLFELSVDAYIADAVAYGAAAELCDRSEDELFFRIKYRFDELMANRYNVDKLNTPPFNRVYSTEKRGRNVI